MIKECTGINWKITAPPLYELADCSRSSRAVRRTLFSCTHGSVHRLVFFISSLHTFNVLITRLFVVCENWQIREQHEALDAFISIYVFSVGYTYANPLALVFVRFHSLNHTYHNIHSYLGFHGSSSCKQVSKKINKKKEGKQNGRESENKINRSRRKQRISDSGLIISGVVCVW